MESLSLVQFCLHNNVTHRTGTDLIPCSSLLIIRKIRFKTTDTQDPTTAQGRFNDLL